MNKNQKTEKKQEKYNTGWVEVDVNDLVKADWNYKNEDVLLSEKLKSNIKLNGQIENIIIYLLPTGFYCILNGNHRYDVLKELNYTKVMCYNMGAISDSKAKRIAVETNESRFATDNIKLAEIISEIGKEFATEDLISTMPYSEDEINGFNNLLNFNWQQFNNDSSSSDTVSDNLSSSDTDISTTDLKIVVTNEVFVLWKEWKTRLSKLYPEDKITDNKALEFALAEAISTHVLTEKEEEEEHNY